MARDLTDRVLVITGASSGIGAATALKAADAGMHVTLAARRADKLMHVAKQVADRGRKAHFFTCNVANPQDVRRLFDETMDRFGRVDAAFANAGYGMEREAHAVPLAEHRRLFEVNYWGTVYTLQEALRAMVRTADGLNHLLVTSSCLSEMGPPKYGPYAATKAAQDSLAQAMRAELHDRGFDVTSVHPVLTRTEFFDNKTDAAGANQRTADEVYAGPLVQSAEHVARRVVRAIRSPTAEVWPAWWSRFGFAAATACPGLTAWALRRAYAKQRGEHGHRTLNQSHIEQAQATPDLAS
ncbi:MAG: SDR family NAD(P)-dependent oxidoreductase [Planctomycetota bacterium]